MQFDLKKDISMSNTFSIRFHVLTLSQPKYDEIEMKNNARERINQRVFT